MGYRLLALSLAFSTALITCSCGSKMLYNKAVANPAPLQYLVEPASVEKNSKKIYLETDTSFIPYMLPGKVSKVSGYILPLIFYWKFHSSHKYQLERKAIQQAPHEFLYTGFLREARRKCHFSFTNNKEQADYLLVVRLDSTGSSSIINSDSHTIVVPLGPYVYSTTISTRNLEQAQAFCRISYELFDKNNRRLRTNSFIATRPIPDFRLMGVPLSYQTLVPAANAAMVEGVGECFRENFESVIKDLNALKAAKNKDELKDLIGKK